MSPDSKPFPIYQLQDAFEAFCNGEPAAKPQHRSLYYFLLGYCRRRGNAPRFNLAYEAGMHGSGIGSWATYDTALKTLAEWGFILYTPGANRYKVPVVELTFRNPTDDVLLTYWQSYCLSTANPTDDVLATQLVTLKEVLNKGKEEIEKLESEKTQYQADVAAANAALVESQKKIGELESEVGKLKVEIDHYATELYAEPMPPGLQAERPPAAATPGGATDVGTALGDGQNGQNGQKPAETDIPDTGKLTKQRGGKPLEPEHFPAFWQAYPRHDDRAGAVAAFRKLAPADQEAAAARAAAWLAARPDIVSARGDFRPHPATWLNKRRWTDAQPAAPIQQQSTNPQQHAVYPPGAKPGAAIHHVPAVTSYGKL